MPIKQLIVTVAVLVLSAAACADHDWDIVITEIMYNPDSTENTGQTEWVEIANVSSETVELTDWRLDDEDDQDWGRFSCTLQPGQVAVLVNSEALDEDDFRKAWDVEPESAAADDAPRYLVIPVTWASLANSADEDNEVLRLLDQHDDIACEVNYHSGGDWPDVSRPDGPSIYLTDFLATDLNLPEHWARSVAGTAGARKNNLTPIFNGEDIGSPGYVEGLTAETTRKAEDQPTPPQAEPKADEPEDEPEPEPEPDPDPED